jgi:hypothetical protein
MENANQQTADEIRQRIANNPQLQSLSGYLMDSEYELILFMSAQGVWQGQVPQPPDGFQPGDGSIELGLFRYWIQYPGQLDLHNFSSLEQILICALCLGRR